VIRYERSVCPHDCPDTCGLLVGVEEGRVVSVKGDPEHPFTRGAVCMKVARYPERLVSPLRVLHPLRRTGPKGSGSFERISWDRVLDEIVERYRRIAEKEGAEAILPYSYAGTMGLVHYHAGHPFFHRLGASRLRRTICSAAAEAGFSATMGNGPSTDIETVVASDLILIWGSNTLATNMHAWPFFLEARRRGGRIICIDPYRNRTAAEADRHVMLRPGTDAALALGMMHVLVEEDLLDRDFIARYTLGFEELAGRIAEYPPSRAEKITGVGSDEIIQLALEYGRARSPYIRTGWGPSRHPNGGMAIRTIACLPGLVGATHKRGGGITRSTSGAFALNKAALEREDLGPRDVRTVNMIQLGHALTSLKDPPILALHVYHSNPAVVAPDSTRVLKGLAREDLFTVVHEHMMTDTALYADIVLPAAMSMETTDLYRSYGHYYLQMARPVMPPPGETRSTLAIFQDLARRFGFTEEVFGEDEESLIRRLLQSSSPYLKGVTWEKISRCEPVRLNVPENPFSDGFKTPSGRIEFYSKSMEAQGLDPLPAGEAGVDREGLGRYPLQLITPPRREFLNSTFCEIESLRARAGGPFLWINPVDAGARGITEGSRVRVFNDRGHCVVEARVTPRTTAGVTVIEGLVWLRFMPGSQGINHLTSQELTDMGGGCAFHCNLVEVERVEGEYQHEMQPASED